MVVVWRITQACNLSCPFCSYDRTRAIPRTEADLATVLNFGAVLAAFQRETGRRVLVSWIGGEPFLWRHLRAATAHLVGSCGLAVSVTTNGTALQSPELREFAGDHFAELTLSVDAPDARHDALRGWPGGFAALERVIVALVRRRRERGRGPKLRLNTVLMRATIGAYEELCRRAADWGVDELTFNALGGRDRPEFYPEHRLRPEDIATLAGRLPALRRELAAAGVNLVGGESYLTRLRASAAGEPRPIADCRPGESFLFVDEAGRAGPCNFTAAQVGVPLDELGAVDAVLALPGRLAAARSRCRPQACEDCHSTQVWAKFQP